jgi:hypothetical protein
MKLSKKDKGKFGAAWINANIHKYNIGKQVPAIQKEINQYITLKLEQGRTFIYVNGKRFIQCIRLILNIPKDDVPLYDEIDSIDEAANLYSKHVFQNRIVRGPMARPVPNQGHNITPEQEFWGHCSNIQAWVEHDYDTRILMSNISFPLLRELTKAGDPIASKVFKEEIALRLESGYPSVVQYLLNQGYIKYFDPTEFKTIVETTELINGLSSNPKMLSMFLLSCISRFPALVENVLMQILKLSEGKQIILSSMNISPSYEIPLLRPHFRSNPQYMLTLKTALENLFIRVDEKTGKDILECIQIINSKLEGLGIYTPHWSGKDYLEAMKTFFIENMPLDELDDEQKIFFKERILKQIRRVQSRCSYCGKVIPIGQDICDWCGHKRDDGGGFFPFPYVKKPPGGGGGSTKGTIVVPLKIKS